MLRHIWWLLVWIGRPFGGIRPRRITNWLAKKAYGDVKPTLEAYRWHRDFYGTQLLLHPHFFIDSQIIAFGAYDVQTNNYIKKHIKPGMVCLDVGANIGVMSVHLARKVGPSGVVHSFEPIPHLFQHLQLHIERNKMQEVVRLHQLALSDKADVLPITAADELFSNQGMASLVNKTHPDLIATLNIETTTLDQFAKREQLTKVDFVKVDIQGAEPLFLQGGRSTLMTLKPDLLIEVSPDDLAQGGTDSKELLHQIESMGYTIFKLTNSGEIGDRLEVSNIPPDFSSDGVLCRMKTDHLLHRHECLSSEPAA